MNDKNYSELSDQALLEKAQQVKSNAITNALLIGFLIGILIYSIMVNSIGLLSLIPLFFVFKLLNNPKKNEALEQEVKARNLK